MAGHMQFLPKLCFLYFDFFSKLSFMLTKFTYPSVGKKSPAVIPCEELVICRCRELALACQVLWWENQE